MKTHDIHFEKLIPNNEQIVILYDLLDRRNHTISHSKQPTFKQHETFVASHPYRAWYLVNIKNQTIGSFYVSNQNTIGINIEGHENIELVSKILKYVHKTYRPLEAIQSVRSNVFTVNIAPTNTFLLNAMKTLGSEVAQITFYIPRF